MALPTYQKANVQVAQPGGQEAAGLMAKAQAKSTLSQRLSSFSEQVSGLAKDMAHTQGARDAVVDVHKRRQEVNSIREKVTSGELSEDDANQRIDNIATAAEKSFIGTYSKAYNGTALSAYSNQVTVDTKIASDKAKMASNGDPDAYNEMFKKFQEETVRSAPTKETAIVAGQAAFKYGSEGYKELSIAKMRRIAKENFDKFQSSSELQSSDYLKLIQEGRQDEASIALVKLQETLKSGANEGYLNPDDIETSVKKLTEKGILLYADDRMARMEEVDARAFINDFRTRPNEQFDEAKRNEISDRMEYVLETHLKKRSVLSKAEAKEQKDNSTIAIKDGIKVLKSGKMPDNIDDLMGMSEFTTAANKHEFEVQLRAFEVSRPFKNLSLPEQQAQLNMMEATEEGTRESIEVLSIIKSNLKERATKAKNDPISLGAEEGYYQQTRPITPDSQPQEMFSILSERLKQQAVNITEYGKGSTQLLTKPEAEQFTEWFKSSSTSEDQKLGLLENIESTIPDNSMSFYNQILKTGASEIGFAGGLIKDGKKATAKKIIHGMSVLKALNNPEEAGEMRTKLLKNIGNATRKMGEGTLNAILDSGVSLYAYTLEDQGIFDKGASSSDMKKIIKELTNGTHMRNGQDFFLPTGATDDDVDEWIDELKPEEITDVAGVSKEEAVRIIQLGELHNVGAGKYAVFYQDRALKNTDGSTFILGYAK